MAMPQLYAQNLEGSGRPTEPLLDAPMREQVETPKKSNRELIDLLRDLQTESDDARTKSKDGCLSLIEGWELSGRYAIGDQWNEGTSAGLTEGYTVAGFGFGNATTAGLKSAWNSKAVFNRIGPAIISNTASQSSPPLLIKLEPVESQDEPEVWLRNRGVRKIKRLLDAAMMEYQVAATALVESGTPPPPPPQDVMMTLAPEQTVGKGDGQGAINPLSDEQADRALEMIDQGLLTPEDVRILNDETVTRAGQKVFDYKWSQALGEMRSTGNIYLCNMFGHQPIRLQWYFTGQYKNTFQLENTNILNVGIDPRCEWIDQARFLPLRYLLSYEEAVAAWPDKKEALKIAARKGARGGGQTRMATADSETDFKREMVLIGVTWIRNRPVPMTIEEAVKDGAVMLAQPTVDPMTQQAIEPESVWVLKATNEPTSPQSKDGPASDNWPTTIGIQQVTWLPDCADYDDHAILEDCRCPYLDIPYGWSINIQRPYMPYGESEPMRLMDVQDQINRIFTLIKISMSFGVWKVRYMRRSTLERLQALGTQLNVEPGDIVPVDDEDFNAAVAGGGRLFIEEQGDSLWQQVLGVLDRLLDYIDRQAGNVGVRQGESPTSGASNMLAETLLSASVQPLALKSAYTEWSFERLARIGFDCCVNWMENDEWLAILGGEFTWPMIESIREKLRDSKRNFRVEATRGRGSTRQQDEQKSILMYDKRLKSRRDAMIDMGDNNPDGSLRQMQREIADEAKASAGIVGGEQPSQPGQNMPRGGYTDKSTEKRPANVPKDKTKETEPR